MARYDELHAAAVATVQAFDNYDYHTATQISSVSVGDATQGLAAAIRRLRAQL